ncbi:MULTISPECIES: Spx/MgsR family RNA polymerase-binding regulatory protein [Snodgrassella]|uniref:Arsenate reductase n=1 Tax=Snodgrassella alvi TaxID=1196083 RepID=A0A2N9WUL2_9NEIS|nr:MULTISPECIES: Spx/MgsR family RNA polymerase-binding regulatory protein [Snodgrassella]NUE66898.1 Spx/MgsR family RNA polymerase-binding regulatory protein [Snodgrassella sp. ESL0253]PIT16392.1 arsenate reductase [Snodgrassella alvi]
MSIRIYGISQCNTVKKARQWLAEQHINAEFIDFKKIPPTVADIQFWLTQIPKETLINRKGTTWRKLSTSEQQNALSSDEAAINLMINQPSVIKRPVLVNNQRVLVGFDAQQYTEFLA